MDNVLNKISAKAVLPVSSMTSRLKPKKLLLIAPLLKGIDIEAASVTVDTTVNCLDIEMDINSLRELLWAKGHHLIETSAPNIYAAYLVFGKESFYYTVIEHGENRTVICL